MILVAIGKTSERELLFHRAIKVFRDITKMPQHLVALGHHENGAPFIKGADDINVSITHSGEYLCIALSKDKVGIDIQERKDIDFKNNQISITKTYRRYSIPSSVAMPTILTIPFVQNQTKFCSIVFLPGAIRIATRAR